MGIKFFRIQILFDCARRIPCIVLGFYYWISLLIYIWIKIKSSTHFGKLDFLDFSMILRKSKLNHPFQIHINPMGHFGFAHIFQCDFIKHQTAFNLESLDTVFVQKFYKCFVIEQAVGVIHLHSRYLFLSRCFYLFQCLYYSTVQDVCQCLIVL